MSHKTTQPLQPHLLGKQETQRKAQEGNAGKSYKKTGGETNLGASFLRRGGLLGPALCSHLIQAPAHAWVSNQ